MANYNTLMGALEECVPEYVAKYIVWYMSPEDKRESWDSFKECDEIWCKYTEEDAELEYISRPDVQDAMQVYCKFYKRHNLMQLYQSMYKKAMNGDVRAADWVVKFSESDFFDESADEINDFLSGINIKGLEAKK